MDWLPDCHTHTPCTQVVLLSHGSAGSSVELSRSELRLSAALQVGAELQAADSSLVAVTNLEPVFMMSASSVSTATVSGGAPKCVVFITFVSKTSGVFHARRDGRCRASRGDVVCS